MTAPIHSRVVEDAGRALFGDEWVAPLARLAGVSRRTVFRIKAAALQGEDYPASPGVMAALSDALEPVQAIARPYRRKA